MNKTDMILKELGRFSLTLIVCIVAVWGVAYFTDSGYCYGIYDNAGLIFDEARTYEKCHYTPAVLLILLPILVVIILSFKKKISKRWLLDILVALLLLFVAGYRFYGYTNSIKWHAILENNCETSCYKHTNSQLEFQSCKDECMECDEDFLVASYKSFMCNDSGCQCHYTPM